MRVARIRFDRPLQDWDGFGFNYVEACQTRDYDRSPQDYGGFGLLPSAARAELVEAVFGEDGLRPGLLKMFLDPFHQEAPDDGVADLAVDLGRYDHGRTTRWMRAFAEQGAQITRARGGDLGVIATLYGPPAWMTRQGFVRGRDLDPTHRAALARYVVSWALYLRDRAGLDVRAVSLHNEGEDWMRWPADGSGPGEERHDYNLHWSPRQVAEMLPLVREALDRNGLRDVMVSPGETTNWIRFDRWGYVDAILDNPEALRALGLVTSHGFYAGGMHRWSADHRSAGADRLRAAKPGLHVWTTSTGWGRGFLEMLWEIEQGIHSTKLNAYIPWAGIQRHALWTGGDPNPQTAIVVAEDGSYRIMPEYYVYKHACRAGQPGMRVVASSVNDSEIVLFGFSGEGTRNPCAFVLANVGTDERVLRVEPVGAEGKRWRVRRSGDSERWADVGEVGLPDQVVVPPRSVATYFEA